MNATLLPNCKHGMPFQEYSRNIDVFALTSQIFSNLNKIYPICKTNENTLHYTSEVQYLASIFGKGHCLGQSQTMSFSALMV